jgi:hypothetical protein
MRKNYTLYHKEQLEEVIKECNGNKSIKLVDNANKYEVPYNTLQDHIQKPNTKTNSGPTSYKIAAQLAVLF